MSIEEHYLPLKKLRQLSANVNYLKLIEEYSKKPKSSHKIPEDFEDLIPKNCVRDTIDDRDNIEIIRESEIINDCRKVAIDMVEENSAAITIKSDLSAEEEQQDHTYCEIVTTKTEVVKPDYDENVIEVDDESNDGCVKVQEEWDNPDYADEMSMETNLDEQQNDNDDRTNHFRESKSTRIKKPLNAFMLFMKQMRPLVADKQMNSSSVNKLLGRMWHQLSQPEQAQFYEMAKVEQRLHKQKYPDYNASLNYGKKKKRAKRPTQQDNSNERKCRGLYGVNKMESWCSNCRRKKKCINIFESDNRSSSDNESKSTDSYDWPKFISQVKRKILLAIEDENLEETYNARRTEMDRVDNGDISQEHFKAISELCHRLTGARSVCDDPRQCQSPCEASVLQDMMTKVYSIYLKTKGSVSDLTRPTI